MNETAIGYIVIGATLAVLFCGWPKLINVTVNKNYYTGNKPVPSEDDDED